jgi:signal transduction histidine kinase
VLDLLDDAPRTFSPADVALLERFTPLAAAALEQTRLLEEERARWREAETLREAGAAVTETLSLDERLRRILEQLDRVVPYDSASVQLLRDDYLEIVGGRGLSETETVIGLKIPIPGDNPNTAVVVGRKPIILADAKIAYPPFRRPPNDYIRSWLGVPLIVRDQMIGMLAVDSVELGHFNAEHVRLVAPFANQAAIAIENARLYEGSQRRLREMNSLLEISQNVISTLELDEVLRRVIKAAITAIGPAEKGTLHLLDKEQEELAVRASVGFSPETVAVARFKPGEGYTGWVFAHQQPLIVSNVKADPRTKPIDLLEVHEERSALCVPLIVQDRTIGTVTLDNVSRYNAFTPEHLDLLTVFANQVAVAIENARLYERAQQEIAERMRAEEALRQHAAKLQARNEELDAFAHTVAHDLKNPLGYIVGFAEALEESYATMPGEESRRYLHTMAQSGRKMGRIIDELLLLACVRKVTEVEMDLLDTASIVAEAQGRLALMIEEHQAEIILPDTWPVALGYGPWIEEVWVNYLSNAIKYGGQPPRVELGATVQPDGMVRFWVRDNGPGLLPEEQTRLFTLFTRLDQVRAKGHGLGLSIARRIVEKLGGQVGIESEIGKGSVFSFTLPGAAA